MDNKEKFTLPKGLSENRVKTANSKEIPEIKEVPPIPKVTGESKEVPPLPKRVSNNMETPPLPNTLTERKENPSLARELSENDVRMSSATLAGISSNQQAGKLDVTSTSLYPKLQRLDETPNDDFLNLNGDISESDSRGSGTLVEPFPQVKEEASKATSAHYEVDVHHYAKYDDVDSGYTEATRKSLTYASQTPFMRFLGDLIMILTRPGAFWKAQDEHPATTSQLYWPHLTILILLRTMAIMGGGAFQYAISEVPVGHLILTAAIQALMIFILMWIMSVLISGISTLAGAGFQFERAQKYVGYSLTPILVVGILSLIPLPYVDTICDLIAMPWAFLVMGAGVLPYLKLKSEQGPILTGVFCGLLLTLWGIVPILIPRLIGLLFATH